MPTQIASRYWAKPIVAANYTTCPPQLEPKPAVQP